jgi:TonB family protein
LITASAGFTQEAMAQPASASPHGSMSHQFAFDIPAQPVVSALDAFSTATGLEVLYGSSIALGRRSTAVHGTLTGTEALRLLLAGTGLSGRSIGQNAVTIEAVSQNHVPPQAEPPAGKSAHQRYYGLIQTALERQFCKNSEIRPGQYRAVLKFTVAPNGQIRQSSLVGSTGDRERDRAITRTLDTIAIEVKPPADLPQPIMMVILPQSSGNVLNCTGLQ